MKFEITAFEMHQIAQVQAFTDRWIGDGYFSRDELHQVLEFSQKQNLNASFLAYEKKELCGVRLSYLPGSWVKTARGLSPQNWQVSPDRVGYFKSLFIADSAQKQGLGKSLSEKSLSVMKAAGAEAVVCHSWIESPDNSSRRYLESMGFAQVGEHPMFWEMIDYLCTRCAPQRCQCTAAEMMKMI